MKKKPDDVNPHDKPLFPYIEKNFAPADKW